MSMEKIELYLERFCIFAGVFFFLFVYPHGIHGDGTARFEALVHFLDTGKSLPVVYSYIGPLISSPLLLLGKIIKTENWWISRFNTFLFLGLLHFLMKKIRSSYGGRKARRFALLFLAGTMFPRHIADYYSEVFSVATIIVALFYFTEEKWNKSLLPWLLSIWNTPGTLVAAIFTVIYNFTKQPRLRFILFSFLAAAGIFAETYWKFGTLIPTIYLGHNGYRDLLPYSGRPGFSYPLFFGVLSVLFSFGKGLIFFTPGLLAFFVPGLPENEQWKNFRRLSLVYLFGLILVYARWWAWHADWFWGPRFYLFASVPAVLGIFFLWEKENRNLGLNALLLSLITLSVWVSAQGIAFGTDDLADACGIEGGKAFFMCHYVPEMSALWHLFIVEHRPVNGAQLSFLLFHVLAYLVLSAKLWLVFTVQVLIAVKPAMQRIFQVRNWKW